ncbi:hypothetical protein VTI74DRAFT_5644 [Chaetomium olivicolor]
MRYTKNIKANELLASLDRAEEINLKGHRLSIATQLAFQAESTSSKLRRPDAQPLSAQKFHGNHTRILASRALQSAPDSTFNPRATTTAANHPFPFSANPGIGIGIGIDIGLVPVPLDEDSAEAALVKDGMQHQPHHHPSSGMPMLSEEEQQQSRLGARLGRDAAI